MSVTIFGGDLRTGEIKVRGLPARTGNVSTMIGRAGEIKCSVPLPMRIPGTDLATDLYTLLQPGKSFLGWEEGGVILNAGPIWNDKWDLQKQELEINAAGLRSYWQYRFVLPLLSAADLPSGRDTVFRQADGLDLATIAKRLVQQAQLDTRGRVPLVFEADRPGVAERTYLGADLHVVEEKLRQISEVLNGPEIMFMPRYTDSNRTHIEWVMRTGDPLLIPNAARHSWDASGMPNPQISNASVTRNAAKLTTDNYQTGATDDEVEDAPPLMAHARDNFLTALGYPMLETSEDRTSVINVDLLQSYADQAVLTGRQYATQWNFRVQKDLHPGISDVLAGDLGRVNLKNDSALGSGNRDIRVLGVNSTLGGTDMLLTCAPERENV